MDARAAPASSVGSRPARLRVGVLGAGRAGSVLGAALHRAGHPVVAVSAVSDASVRRAKRLLPGAARLAPDEVVDRAELVLIAVPDDVLTPLVRGLAAAGAFRPGQLVAHVAGAHGLEPLEPATAVRALPLALHPVMTFGDRPEDLDRLAGVCFGVTAPEPLRPVAEALAVEMGGEPVWIENRMRPLYHAALAVGSNHLATIVAEAADLLRRAGVAEPGRMLGPLLGASLDGALTRGDAALTGPVVRGDAGTIAAHLATLDATAPDAVAAYVALARRTAVRALAAGRLRPEAAEALLGTLGDDAMDNRR